MTSYRPSYIIVVQEKSDVMNEVMEYVYCLIYIVGIAFCGAADYWIQLYQYACYQ